VTLSSGVVVTVVWCLSLKLMQAEVEQLQEKVNGLHSMVVVVDENNAESGNFVAVDVFYNNRICRSETV